MTDRSLVKFEEGIKSQASLGTYLFGLERFRNYYKLKTGDALLTINHKKLQEMIEDYVFDLKKKVSPNSVSTYMKGVEHFFIMNDVIVNWKKIHKFYPEKVKTAGGNAYTTEDIQKMLELAKSLKRIALIHVLASTGARIGAISELKLIHVSDLTDSCKVIKFYPDSKFEYYGFLTPEASRALDRYLEQRKRDGEYISQQSPLFRSKYTIGSLKAKPSTTGALKNLIRTIVTASISREKVGRRYNKAMDHAFRKRFNTILKNNQSSNRSLTEKLMSHEVKAIPLDGTYYDPDIPVLFDEFKKHILNLTVDSNERQRIELEAKTKKITELEAKNKEISELKSRVSRLAFEHRHTSSKLTDEQRQAIRDEIQLAIEKAKKST